MRMRGQASVARRVAPIAIPTVVKVASIWPIWPSAVGAVRLLCVAAAAVPVAGQALALLVVGAWAVARTAA
jgi:hypothetical protein